MNSRSAKYLISLLIIKQKNRNDTKLGKSTQYVFYDSTFTIQIGAWIRLFQILGRH